MSQIPYLSKHLSWVNLLRHGIAFELSSSAICSRRSKNCELTLTSSFCNLHFTLLQKEIRLPSVKEGERREQMAAEKGERNISGGNYKVLSHSLSNPHTPITSPMGVTGCDADQSRVMDLSFWRIFLIGPPELNHNPDNRSIRYMLKSGPSPPSTSCKEKLAAVVRNSSCRINKDGSNGLTGRVARVRPPTFPRRRRRGGGSIRFSAGDLGQRARERER